MRRRCVSMLGPEPRLARVTAGPCCYRRAMRAERADVIIIGAGLAGSAAARALAGRGRSVVLLEQVLPGHRRGSSHGTARNLRRAYPDPLYLRPTGQVQVPGQRPT